MRTLIVAAVIAACCGPVQASDYVTVGGFSYHSERHRSNGKDWNEVNPGLGFERDLSESWTFTSGIYRNSFARTTAFAGASWEPIRLGPAKFGLMAAAASGYPSPVVGAITADLKLSNRIDLTLLGAPVPGSNGGAVLATYARIMLGK
ncbi:MAG TPA: hypothetical protein VEP67_03475 [Thiobacillaceae bacterium]|nr:hypothetical protein [Thiobacillaceae bacterium]